MPTVFQPKDAEEAMDTLENSLPSFFKFRNVNFLQQPKRGQSSSILDKCPIVLIALRKLSGTVAFMKVSSNCIFKNPATANIFPCV